MADPSKKDTRWYRQEYLSTVRHEMDVGYGKDVLDRGRSLGEALRELERLHRAGNVKEFHALERRLTSIKSSMEIRVIRGASNSG